MCLYPIPAYQKAARERPKLHPPLGTANISLPCGGCLECRKKNATTWGIRCGHHAIGLQHVSFNTLTFNDEHLPDTSVKWVAPFQRFMKRLRVLRERKPELLLSDPTKPISFFNCAEYGDKVKRPHYHPLLFNVGFADRTLIGKSKSGEDQFHSETLQELWSENGEPIGHAVHSIAADPARAGCYAAKHNMKQLRRRDEVDADGVLIRVKPFVTMSNRPAIGMEFLNRYAEDLRTGAVIQRGGNRHAIPRGYMKYLERTKPDLFEEIQHKIAEQLRNHRPSSPEDDDNHPDRRAAREIILQQQADAAERQRSL